MLDAGYLRYFRAWRRNLRRRARTFLILDCRLLMPMAMRWLMAMLPASLSDIMARRGDEFIAGGGLIADAARAMMISRVSLFRYSF